MANQKLLDHNATQFKKQIVELRPGFYTAVGFAASTQHMVVGDTSATIIDTSESTGAAQNVLAAFREVSDKPIGRIIYTHSHRDHISGATVFAGEGDLPILAHPDFASDLVSQDATRIAPYKSLGRRTQAQFGIGLTAQERVSLGCGPGDRPMEGLGAGYLPPTEWVADGQMLDLDGHEAQVIFAPGETSDHIALWFADSGILFPGDNWYHAFPNLYAIRGTPFREFALWAETLTKLSELGAEVLAPGHTQPVFGREKIVEVLTSTRDAIVHVMQHTADGMDAGLSFEDIAASIALPAELAEKRWLGEFYGKASWSARAFAVGTLGWYDGNPTNLGTLTSERRARHMAELAGGAEALMAAAQASDDPQWTLELCDHLLALGHDARLLKADTMAQLAETEVNATARNTYLWEAKRLRDTEG